MRNLCSKLLPLFLASLLLGPSGWALQSVDAQSNSTQVESRKSEPHSEPNPAADPARENKVGVSLIRNLGHDQLAIWSTPTKVRLRHLYWIIPASGSLAFLAHYDSDISERLPNGTSFINRSSSLSNYGIASALGVAGGLYLWGHVKGNEHARETGFLSGEAAVDSFALVTVGKYAAGRERPNALQHSGDFRSGGASFPSAHAAVAFSIATVLAHEYPGIGTKLLSYGAATGISASRVLGREHFVTDVTVGAAIGWFTGWQVYRAHHNTALAGDNWGTIEKSSEDTETKVRTPGDMGSPYVALDSWVYPALDRLAALGIIRTGFSSLRPWTRMECARQVREASERLGDESTDAQEYTAYSVLKSEFAPELGRLDGETNVTATVESLYTRSTFISGPPLTDSYHFGQTIINDFGRPFRRGFNSIAGGSARATAGPFVFYVRGEYQHSPSAPALSPGVLNAIGSADFRAPDPSIPSAEINRARLLEAYAGVQVKNWMFSFGRQSLWWGPGENSPMLFSDNAEPITMLKVDRVSPVNVPLVSKLLGPLRVEAFVGQLSGHNHVNTEVGFFSSFVGRPVDPQPYIHGEKLAMKPTPNFEFSVSRTAIFGGPAFPFNLRRFWPTYYSQNNHFGVTDPGDQRGAADMSYRLPGLRDWATLYVDAFTEDQPSPLLFPERAAVRAGLHLPQLPRLKTVELWAEGSYSDLPPGALFPGYHYFNVRYLDGYTNEGNLLGGWVGRQGAGGAVSGRWWVSPDSSIELAYRNSRTSSQFMQGGGRQNDFGCKVDLNTRSGIRVGGSAQLEWWRIPVLSTEQNRNFTLALQVSYTPKWFGRQ